VKKLIQTIVKELDMELIGQPHVYYVDEPASNKGITSASSIITSHISFHYWDTPESGILKNPKSKSLLQLDLYTCGNLNMEKVGILLKHLEMYVPTRIDVDILNRKSRLQLDAQLHWNDVGKQSFGKWLELKFL
jgi:S-adenosylmethionine/arginine decarboxylase-like enzyme